MKYCNKCSRTLGLLNFSKCLSKKDGHQSSCKECRSAQQKAAPKKDQSARYQSAEYKESSRQYYLRNADKIKEKAREWSASNPERKKASARKHYAANKDAYLSRASEWASSNPDKRRVIALDYMRRNQDDPEFKAASAARKFLARLLFATGRKKPGRTASILGYTKSELVAHMQARFAEGMTWDNHGEWHIDHIVPLSVLIGLGITEPSKVNALANLQPKWAFDNLSKHDGFELVAPSKAMDKVIRK